MCRTRGRVSHERGLCTQDEQQKRRWRKRNGKARISRSLHLLAKDVALFNPLIVCESLKSLLQEHLSSTKTYTVVSVILVCVFCLLSCCKSSRLQILFTRSFSIRILYLKKKNYLDFNQDGQQTFWVVLHPLDCAMPCVFRNQFMYECECVCVSGDSYGRVEELSLLPHALSNDNSHLSLLCVCVCICVCLCVGVVCVCGWVCVFCSVCWMKAEIWFIKGFVKTRWQNF
jgi:hypothetical protein